MNFNMILANPQFLDTYVQFSLGEKAFQVP